jgi:hypothetical protein
LIAAVVSIGAVALAVVRSSTGDDAGANVAVLLLSLAGAVLS